jgi:hypothetical protein
MEPMRETWMMAAKLTRKPMSTYTLRLMLWMFMPDNLAARSLEPTAMTCLPKVVRVKTM